MPCTVCHKYIDYEMLLSDTGKKSCKHCLSKLQEFISKFPSSSKTVNPTSVAHREDATGKEKTEDKSAAKPPVAPRRIIHEAKPVPKRYPVKAGVRVKPVSLKARSHSVKNKVATSDLVVHLLVMMEALLHANEEQARAINALSARMEEVLPASDVDAGEPVRRIKSFVMDAESSALIRSLVTEHVTGDKKKEKKMKEKKRATYESDDEEESPFGDLFDGDEKDEDDDDDSEIEILIDEEFLDHDPESNNEPPEDEKNPFVEIAFKSRRSKKLKATSKPTKPSNASPSEMASLLASTFSEW